MLQGVIMDGGVQWMTAGRGIVHSEMPVITTGDLWGFQLWINLPAKDKMIKPRYQDIQAAEIPTVATGESDTVRVLAGSFGGQQGAPTAPRLSAALGDMRDKTYTVSDRSSMVNCLFAHTAHVSTK